jgi:hypothetical protein
MPDNCYTCEERKLKPKLGYGQVYVCEAKNDKILGVIISAEDCDDFKKRKVKFP